MYTLGSLTWANFIPTGIPQSAIIPNAISAGFSLLILIIPIYPLVESFILD
jgi:hypothetical protein